MPFDEFVALRREAAAATGAAADGYRGFKETFVELLKRRGVQRGSRGEHAKLLAGARLAHAAVARRLEQVRADTPRRAPAQRHTTCIAPLPRFAPPPPPAPDMYRARMICG